MANLSRQACVNYRFDSQDIKIFSTLTPLCNMHDQSCTSEGNSITTTMDSKLAIRQHKLFHSFIRIVRRDIRLSAGGCLRGISRNYREPTVVLILHWILFKARKKAEKPISSKLAC